MSPSVSIRLLLTQSDERLVGYARAGHERAFEALVQRYRRQLLSYCRRLLLPEERAEDAVQQALVLAGVRTCLASPAGRTRTTGTRTTDVQRQTRPYTRQNTHRTYGSRH